MLSTKLIRALNKIFSFTAFSHSSLIRGPIEKRPNVEFDIIVIGAGMSGLSAATHLGVAGLKVLVLEQHSKIGGCTSSFSRGEFHFDAAMHEMNSGRPGTLVGDLFAAAGMTDKVDLIPIPSTGRSILPGVDIRHGHNVDGMIRVLSEHWPQEKEGIAAFYREMRKITGQMKSLAEIYRLSPFRRAGLVIAALFNSPAFVKRRKATLQQMLDDHLTDPNLKAVISQWWIYYGPPPSQLWGPLYIHATHSYLEEGAFQVRGSSMALANAYSTRIQELGGTIELGANVTHIDVVDGQVRGVTTEDGRTFTSRYVVSSADPTQTFERLLAGEHAADTDRAGIAHMEPNVSLVGVYLGLDVEPSFFGIEDYEIVLSGSSDIDAVYQASLEGRYDEGVLVITLYGNLGDPWYAPPGKSVITLNSYGRIQDWPKDAAYPAKKRAMMDALIDRAETILPGLRDHIVVQEGMTPYTIQRYTLQREGAPYGWAATPKQWDRSAQRTSIDGLYLCGAWTAPSHGVAPAQMTGHRAARLILDQEGLP